MAASGVARTGSLEAPMAPAVDPDILPFAWDRRLDAAELRRILADPAHPEYLDMAALLLREARPGNVWQFLTPATVAGLLAVLGPRLGRQRAFWTWLIQEWQDHGRLERTV